MARRTGLRRGRATGERWPGDLPGPLRDAGRHPLLAHPEHPSGRGGLARGRAVAATFDRNIYKEFFRPDATPKEETAVAKIVSLVVKFDALGFIILLNPSFAIDLQLIGG